MVNKNTKSKNTKKSQLPSLSSQPILKPFDIEVIGTNGDPCFGVHYDLSTKECKMCGDSEMCCIMFAQHLGKTRKGLEKENKFKDLDVLYDKEAIFKLFKSLKKKGTEKKAILEQTQSKYELSRQEVRLLYREFINQ